jgi:biopolymer transport protein ExbD
MSFGGFERGQAPSQPMAEINVTPLVDVMLVLLVIFIITAPLLATALKLDLPDVKAPPVGSKAETISLAIDADGALFWNGAALRRGDLDARLTEAARRQPQPELHLRADRNTRYEQLAQIMSSAQQAGLVRIGFVTEPPPTPNAAPAPAVPARK